MDTYTNAAPSSFTLFSPITRISSSYLSSSFKRVSIDRDDDILSSPHLHVPFLVNKLERGERATTTQYTVSKPLIVPRKESDYDLKHGETQVHEPDTRGSSFLQATLNGVNVLAGVGVLSTPYALKEGGWLGLIILFGFAMICCYTGMLLRHCLESEPGLETYPDIGQAAFGNAGRFLISIILYIELYACCVEFLILEGDNLSALFPGAEVNFAGFHLRAHEIFTFLAAVLVLPTVWLRDLSLLAYLSAGGVLSTLLVVAMIFWVGTFEGVGFTQSGPLLNLAQIPVSVGLYGFCYSGHAVFPNIYTSMKNPADFNLVLQLSFLIVTTIYGVTAIMGFTMFGDNTATQITLNLPKNLMSSKIAVWTTVINPVTKFALTMTPVALSLEELLPSYPDSFHYRSSSLAIRTLLVASTVAVAVSVPFFGLVMAFIGSFLSLTVSLILPCACYLSIVGKKATIFQRIMCLSVILVGVSCATIGTYTSILGIINSFYG